MASLSLDLTTFNLRNLNEPGRRMYSAGDAWTVGEVRDKVAWTGTMLARAEADVIGVQELWAPGPLERAIDAAKLGDTHILLAPDYEPGEGIACAAIVRRALLVGEPRWIRDFPEALRLATAGDDQQTPGIRFSLDAFSRPVLHFRIRPRDRDVHVFVCHLKSKAPTKVYLEGWFQDDPDLYAPHGKAIGAALSAIRRTAEAAALRVLLTDLMAGTDEPVVVLGDLNDALETSTLDVVTGQPAFLGPLSMGGGDTALYSAMAMHQAQSRRDVHYTYIHDGVHGTLDHVLVSQEFYSQSRRRIWALDGLDLFNDHLNRPEEELPRGATDHGVVRARFAYRA